MKMSDLDSRNEVFAYLRLVSIDAYTKRKQNRQCRLAIRKRLRNDEISR